jgi:RNA polymerase sigma-70 factor (ECF subfamily)
MRNFTFTDLERLEAQVEDAQAAFQMDEEAFRAFYDRTARPVWVYLSRLTGSAEQADDLLQETYYRFLRAERPFTDERHRRNYLYRIATNLVRDAHRRSRVTFVPVPDADEPGAPVAAGDVAHDAARRTDLGRALAQLKPRERAMLWLAYGQGSTHHEIAESLGLRTSSIKLLLFRARKKLAAVIGSRELPGPGTTRGRGSLL